MAQWTQLNNGIGKITRQYHGKDNPMSDMTVANTILDQLGGRHFIVMTGSKNFVGSDNSLSFHVGRNAKSITHVKIMLNGLDLYDVSFMRIRKGSVAYSHDIQDVYFDDLQTLFTKETGLDTHL